jgi:mono/diheme cytochrome c family protein
MAGQYEEEPLPPGVPPVTYPPREPRLQRPPFVFIAIGVILLVASWVPLVLFARARVERSEHPRISIMQDMGTQPKFREQQTNDLFADNRADRPHVIGTIARGGLQEDDHYFRGFTIATGAGGKIEPRFLEGFPQKVHVDKPLLERGQERFNIYCSACHGFDGYGKGPIEVRSEELGTPLNAKSLHEDSVRGRVDGHIFNTITNGIRMMPSYSAQIPVADRWAIVAYVRALQFSQNAPPSVMAVGSDVPATDNAQASRR